MKINKGIVTSDTLKIIQAIIPKEHEKARPQTKMQAKYITVHNTASEGVNALNHANYITNINDYKSWHFTVDNKEIYQHLPINEVSWHAGDGTNGEGNTQSISVEVCEVDEAEEMAIKFIAELLKTTNLSIEDVTTHQHWSGKYCPRLILNHWDVFISNIKIELVKTQSMTVQEAEKIIQEKAGLDDNTMQYLRFYRYADSLVVKLAKAMK